MIKNILFEDNDIIVIKKPFGIASQSDKSGDLDLYTAVKDYAKGCQVGLIHRLDRPVSGIMVFSKNKICSDILSKQLQNGDFNKYYLAVVCGRMSGKGELTDWILKNQRKNISKIVCKNSPFAKEAVLKYEVLENKNVDEKEFSLVKIKLITGRHHQIRIQMANAGFPVWGDTKYNKELLRKRAFKNIGLCAYKLNIIHPISGKSLSFSIKEDAEPFNMFDF